MGQKRASVRGPRFPALSRSAQGQRDAQSGSSVSLGREARNSWSHPPTAPHTPLPSLSLSAFLPLSPSPDKTNKRGAGRRYKAGDRGGGRPCGQRGRRSAPDSHGEAGCSSARLERRSSGIAAAESSRAQPRGAPWNRAEGTAPHRYRGEPTRVRLLLLFLLILAPPPPPPPPPPQVNEYCGRAAPAVESARAALSLKYDQGCLDASAAR